MRIIAGLLVCIMILTTSVVMATDISNSRTVRHKDNSHVGMNPGTPDGREGGETIEDAFPIDSLPFIDTGNTCDNQDDYEEMCPWGSNSPDVVYAFTALGDDTINIDLCGSEYDTKVFIYENEYTPGNPYACNDDYYYDEFCGFYVSKIEDMIVTGGNTYYIVIDGYSGDCGEYSLLVEHVIECIVECPPGALLEGEPELVDDYEDTWNSGCGGIPSVFQTIGAQEDNCATMCAVSGWYNYYGMDFRDTDWFEVAANGTEIEWTIEAEFDILRIVILPDCSMMEMIVIEQLPACTSSTVTFTTNFGEIFWLWVGPQTFEGPVNEFDYVMEVCGILEDSVASEHVTWGGVKALYR